MSVSHKTFLLGSSSSVIFCLFWMGLLSCLTHPSPVIRSQALTGKATKGCNLPSAECDSGTGRVRNTCEKPPSRSATVTERWWNVLPGECEGQHPCQDWGGEEWRLEEDLPSWRSFWTPPCCWDATKENPGVWAYIGSLHYKKHLVGPAVEQNRFLDGYKYNPREKRSSEKKKKKMMKPFTVWWQQRNEKKNVASDKTGQDCLVRLNGFHYT